ncbi:LDCC motif putative metal-binding protein [Dethiosulfatibacter aminovorans]|nr:LDCC motif putative metal-binding protein [Dethiosulfatibacter aminovorans]
MFAKLKKRWKKFLDNLAEQNKSTYGEGGIDCCGFKNPTEGKPKHNK